MGYLLVSGCSLFFGWAAIQKWRALTMFAQVVADYDVAPRFLIGPATLAIPMLEWTVSVLAWLPSLRATSAIIGSTLLIVYAVVIGVNLVRGRRHIDCGCAMGAERRPIARWMLWRNGILATLLLAIRLPWGTRPLGITDALTIIGGLIGFCLFYLSVDRLITQSPQFVTASRSSE